MLVDDWLVKVYSQNKLTRWLMYIYILVALVYNTEVVIFIRAVYKAKKSSFCVALIKSDFFSFWGRSVGYFLFDYIWHDMVHRAQSRHFSELNYWYCVDVMKHSMSGFVWSKPNLPTLLGYKVMYICVYFCMYISQILYSLFWPVSQFNICRLWIPWTISCHMFQNLSLELR